MKLSRAFWTSMWLSLLFLAVYPTCNWITSKRADVGMLYFQWEMLIPFVPLMIIPYMSIDLFFLAGPFVCRSEAELRTLKRRITFSILAAGICFLLFPLRLAFERPAMHGWLGTVFNTFRGFDKPFNLLPSLHITLRTILASLYARHTSGPVRLASHVWFSLIGFSTVLTYQHQVMDVVGGFVLAGWSFYIFRETPTRLPGLRNRHVGGYYAAGAMLLAGAACYSGRWGWLLLWPAIALAITAGAYFGLGPGIYRKTDDRLPLSALFVLGPCLLGQQLSLAWYRRRCRPYDEVVPGVWIGRRLNHREAADAVQRGVTAALDLTAEFSEAKPFLKVAYLNLPILDLTAPTPNQLKQMSEFIARHAAKGIVYVHCKVGYSRSAAAVGAYLLASREATNAIEAVEKMRRARPSIIVRPEVMAALEQFASHRNTPIPA